MAVTTEIRTAGPRMGLMIPMTDALAWKRRPKLEAPEEWKHSLAIWTLVVFGLLLSLLVEVCLGTHLTRHWSSVSQSIQANIDGAAEQHAKAAALLADHEAKLAGTAEEVRQILGQRSQRKRKRRRLGFLPKRKLQQKSEKNRALQEINAAKNGAIQELAERSVDAAVGMAGSIVKRELKSDDHSSLISEALKHFPSKN